MRANDSTGCETSTGSSSAAPCAPCGPPSETSTTVGRQPERRRRVRAGVSGPSRAIAQDAVPCRNCGMRPEIIPRTDRPPLVRLACPNRPWGRPLKGKGATARGCSGGTQYLKPESAKKAWAAMQSGPRVPVLPNASAKAPRCRCGLLLPCASCVHGEGFAIRGWGEWK